MTIDELKDMPWVLYVERDDIIDQLHPGGNAEPISLITEVWTVGVTPKPFGEGPDRITRLTRAVDEARRNLLVGPHAILRFEAR
ncbi:hypothetical protein [Patulibacter minatonensis]|uniref:hypothetical protein n=1 Tax=Patulibacter minatonensis TaxID=298163 RepID=UPI00047C822A|nr:hypothetical protein [Patulibacter minatonensis]